MIQVGGKVPEATLYRLTANGPAPVATSEVFPGRKVALFGLPGAYTPTCHKQHLPGFLARSKDIVAGGVDAIVCIAVNDPFVMDAWAKEQNVGGRIDMLSDGNAEFTRAMGLDVDLSGAGLGVRSQRYSALVEDGVVKQLNVETDVSAHTICSADHLLRQL